MANTPTALRSEPTTAPPKARHAARYGRWLVQAAIVAAVVALLLWFGVAVRSALARKGIEFSFRYLASPAGFNLSEGWGVALDGIWPDFHSITSNDSNVQVFFAGLTNTLKVAVAAIVLSTIFGTLLGVGRLSTNWVVRNLSFGLVEFVRNTPLLIQIVFWYFAVVLEFPPANAAAKWFGGLIASQSGVYLPSLTSSDAASPWSWTLLIGGLVLLFAALFSHRRALVRPILAAVGLAALAASVWSGFPLDLDVPVATRFGANGGMTLSPEFSAVLLAIVVNSSAYIAEIVRGAIDAIPKGQWEASVALGLSRGQTLRDIVLPQVFRVVLPSLGNRYISLTKDTSLGIAIGYPDLFNVYGTVSNQTGRNLEGMIIVVLTYLVLSWAISGGINLLNRRVSAARISR